MVVIEEEACAFINVAVVVLGGVVTRVKSKEQFHDHDTDTCTIEYNR